MENSNAVYQKAKQYFEQTHPEWICTVEQDCLVIQLNWQNVTYFNGKGLTHSAKTYRHIVKLYPDGHFLTIDATVEDEQTIGLGDISIGREAFAGKKWNFTYEKMLGTDHESGTTGIQTYKFTTSQIQEPVKEYFTDQGYKYKFYSLKEDFRALDGKTKLAVGILFSFIGLVFFIVAMFLFANPQLEITSTTNGITTVKQLGEIAMTTKVLLLLFPTVFVCMGTICITNFFKYNKK